MIYVDHAATTPVHPSVLRVMLPFYREQFANPSSLYQSADMAQKAIDDARTKIALGLNVQTNEIIFTSGGSESINTALKGVAFAQSMAGVGNKIISSTIEHHAVQHSLDYLQEFGFNIVRVPVNSDGYIEPQIVAGALDEATILVSIMLANNEVGVIEPISKIATAVRSESQLMKRRIPIHTDAVQAAGQLTINPNDLDVDLVSISAHKFRGPKGVGALYIRRGTPFLPQQNGGGQERNRRAGTENVPGIVGIGEAFELAESQRKAFVHHTKNLRDRFLNSILKNIDGAICNGPRHNRLPNNANVRFEGVDGKALLQQLAEVGIAASSGSACTTASWEPSHVLIAMGIDQDEASGSLRCTFGLDNTPDDVDTIVSYLDKIVPQLRKKREMSHASVI